MIQSFLQFNEAVKEPQQKSKSLKTKLQLVVLGLGDSEGTLADIISKIAEERDYDYILVHTDKAYVVATDTSLNGIKIYNYDGEGKSVILNPLNSIIFVRAGAISTLASQALVQMLEEYDFFMINSLKTMLTCDNKMTTNIVLGRNNVPIPRSSIVNDESHLELALKHIGSNFPVIIKTLTGTQGVGVSKVNDMASLKSVCQSLWKFNAQLLIQEFLPIKSDIRTLVLNGKIIASAERIKQSKSEFRNNVHMGAITKPYELSEAEKVVIKAAARSVGAIYCGVDHCKIDDNIYVLEVNGSPGIKSSFMGYDIDERATKPIKAERLFKQVIDYYSDLSTRKCSFTQESGYIESVVLDGIEHDPIRAKFDTGNGTKATMLHVDELEVKGGYAHWKKHGVKFKSKILDTSYPQHIGFKDERPIIEHGLLFNNRHYKVKLGLSLKESFSEMLVNRDLLTIFKVSVNPNRKFVLSDWTEKTLEKHK